MNKLEEYRDKLIKTDYPHEEPDSHYCNLGDIQAQSFEYGFDAVIALELPVKYVRWKDSIFKGFSDSQKHPVQWKQIQELFDKLGTSYSEKDLYRYWIDNIFKP